MLYDFGRSHCTHKIALNTWLKISTLLYYIFLQATADAEILRNFRRNFYHDAYLAKKNCL